MDNSLKLAVEGGEIFATHSTSTVLPIPIVTPLVIITVAFTNPITSEPSKTNSE